MSKICPRTARPIILGSYRPSQNGIIVSLHGIVLCIAGEGVNTAISITAPVRGRGAIR